MTTVESDVPQFVDLVSSLSNESKQVYETSTSQLKPPAASSSAAESEQFIPLQSALLMSYTQHLLAISSHRMLGLSLEKDSKGRELVRNLVRMRLQLEKMRPVEARLKPKWERWVRAYEAEEKRRIERGDSDKDASADEKDDEIDPLAFRPNPAALLDPSASRRDSKQSSAKKSSSSRRANKDDDDDDDETSAGVYRPPKLAPVPYTGDRSRRRRAEDVSDSGSDDDRARRRPSRSANSHLLSDLSTALSNNPYAEASSGLASGAGSASGSKRAQRLREMEEYEEANFTRLVQSKKESRKRRRDEEDVALGGATTAGTGRGKVSGGFEEEFGDLLRGGERRGRGRDELDDLSKKRKTQPLGESSGGKRRGQGASGGGGNRFEKAVKSHGKKARK